jgi:hypothetical protein
MAAYRSVSVPGLTAPASYLALDVAAEDGFNGDGSAKFGVGCRHLVYFVPAGT